MAVRGRIDGRPFELTLVPCGSDHGELGVEVEEMTLESAVEAPVGLRVEPSPPLDGEEEAGGARLEGDSTLDRLALLEADDPRELDRFLTPARRQGLLRLLAMEDVDTSGMAGSTLFVRTRRGVSRLEQLEHDLCVLVSVARQLEADAAIDGRC